MPLDQTNWPKIEADTPHARRRRLIEALRDNPQPWDFRHIDTCALGLAVRLGIAESATPHAVGRAIGIGDEQAWCCFATTRAYRVRVLRFFVREAFHKEVTPTMVADALDREIAIGG